MIEDMTIRKFALKTQHDYISKGQALRSIPRTIARFGQLRGRTPLSIPLAPSDVGIPTINQSVSILRFFSNVALRRHDIIEHTHFIHEPRKLPVVLSVEEMARLLDAPRGSNTRPRSGYGADLSANEVVCAHDLRYRQQAHHHPRQAGQGWQRLYLTKWVLLVAVMIVVDIVWLYLGVFLRELILSSNSERVPNFTLGLTVPIVGGLAFVQPP